MTRHRVRWHTWYWGKWVLEGELGLNLGAVGVELYDDALHGWHLSDEARAAASELGSVP